MRGSSFPDYTGAGYNKAMRLPLIIMAAFGCYLFRPALALAQSPIEVITHTVEAAPGFIFTAPPGHLVVADSSGSVVFDRDIGGPVFDFKPLGTGLIYFYQDTATWTALNDNYEPVDNWQAVGYEADVHDFQTIGNNVLLLIYKPQTVDLSPYGGHVTATVESCLIQELDADKNLVWSWDSIDYLPITQTNRSLTTSTVDYSHCNALDVDTDGNLLLSSRHLDEVTKIDHATGAVLWRLGGQGNEFTFTNDDGFALQHDIRRIENGHITLFDNGTPARGYSRAVEYELDEGAKVITRTWEYRGAFAFCCGNAQRLPGGNTFINWGPADPTIIEVNPAGEIVFAAEVGFSYRSYKAPWKVRYYLPVVVKG